ncbi:MAG TPA: VOC family protein [Acidimicrobiia bacterium]|nr:VOC family protein [Acidimicrobiia bacterium]
MEEPGAPIECINAVTLVTADMAAAVEFYEAIGFLTIVGGAGAAFTTFRVGPTFLNLQLDPSAPSRRDVWGRIVFWVDDVDAMYARVQAAGRQPEMTPSDAPWGERYFHVRDPDGHELSFARLLSRSSR